MATITRKWHKLMAVACSHGDLICPDSEKAVLTFEQEFKPKVRAHLGDYLDTAAFRKGAKGTPDEARPYRSDFEAGVNFLKAYRATHVLNGNHETRLWEMLHHHNQVVVSAAEALTDRIRSTIALLGAKHIETYSVRKCSWFEFGGWKFMHGFMFNEMAARDHAEAFGNCVFGHTHRPRIDKGRRLDNPTGICVGTLADIPNMDYAGTRRATLAWNGGFVWGEYCDDDAVFYLCEKAKTGWRLP